MPKHHEAEGTTRPTAQTAAAADATAWLAANAAAIESSNQWVERHGLPLARFRRL